MKLPITIEELKEKENQLITIALANADGRRPKAAKALGISERTLYRKLKGRKRGRACGQL